MKPKFESTINKEQLSKFIEGLTFFHADMIDNQSYKLIVTRGYTHQEQDELMKETKEMFKVFFAL